MSILVVDDDRTSASLFIKRLERRGLEAVWVESGKECLELVEAGGVDIILLDVIMPNMCGDEVLEALRKSYSAVELPIMMVTSKGEAEDIVKFLKLGASDYLPKPVDIDVAVARITSQLELKKLYFDSLAKKEMEALNSMIVTYNHEINNPLTIATYAINRCIKKDADIDNLNKVKEALERITNIVKKIDQITQGKIGKIDYSNGQSMIKIGR